MADMRDKLIKKFVANNTTPGRRSPGTIGDTFGRGRGRVPRRPPNVPRPGAGTGGGAKYF